MVLSETERLTVVERGGGIFFLRGGDFAFIGLLSIDPIRDFLTAPILIFDSCKFDGFVTERGAAKELLLAELAVIDVVVGFIGVESFLFSIPPLMMEFEGRCALNETLRRATLLDLTGVEIGEGIFGTITTTLLFDSDKLRELTSRL